MKFFYRFITLIIPIFIFMGCNSSHNIVVNSPRNMIDWTGPYRGTIISPDLNRTVVLITLNKDMTYKMQQVLVDNYQNVHDTHGTISWNKNGDEITLRNSKTKNKITFSVSEDLLTEIPRKKMERNPILLTKIRTEGITDIYWKLIELNGEEIELNQTLRREPFLLLRSSEGRVIGSGSCNTFNGEYRLGNLNQIRFSKIGSTQIACDNMETEIEMLQMLEEIDNYLLSHDGRTLSLNKSRMAPLARFEIMYLREY